jgi:tetratricopeptide (TPR) repeat protein
VSDNDLPATVGDQQHPACPSDAAKSTPAPEVGVSVERTPGLERDAVEVKQPDKRTRRRLVAGLGSAVLIVLLIVGGVFLLAQERKQEKKEKTAESNQKTQDQVLAPRELAQAARRVQQALGHAKALRGLAQAAPLEDTAQRERAARLWRDAITAANRADNALTGGEVDADTSRQATELLAELRRQAAEAEKDLRMLRSLERAHDKAREPQESDYVRKQRVEEFVFSLAAVPAYAAAFRKYGIDVEALNTQDAIERIRQRPICLQLAFALDDWYFLAPKAAGGRLLDIARAVDPDHLRDRVRDVIARKDRKALKQLADSKEAMDLPVPSLILLGDVLHEQGLQAEGVQLLKRARIRHPQDFWVHYMLGMHLRSAEPPDYGEASRCFSAALALRPSSALGWSNLGDVLAILGRLDDAVGILREAIRIQPDFLLSYQLIAEVLDEKSELDQALTLLQEPIRRHPESPMLQSTLGRVLQSQGKFDAAIDAFRKVLAQHPDWVDARVYLADVLVVSGAEREAQELLDQAERSHPELCQIYEVRGKMRSNKGDVDGALAAYRKAVKFGPSLIRLWSSLADTLTAKGEYGEALQMHRKAILMAPENAAFHVSFADSLRLMGRWNDAETECRLALQLNPRSYLANYALGLILLDQRKYKGAEQPFRQALALRPQHPWSHAYLGMSLRFQKDYRAAAAAVNEAIHLRPDEGTFHEFLSYIAYDQGLFAEAIPHCKECVRLRTSKLGPDNPQTLLSMANLGLTYRDAGRLKEAIPPLETALKRGRKRSGEMPASLAWVPDALAETYERAGQFDKSETIYRDALEQVERKLGPYDLRTATVLAYLGQNLLKQNKHTDAEPLLRRCLIVREAKQPNDWTTFNARSELGEALLGQKKFAEATPLLVEGYQGMKQRQDKIPPALRQIRLIEALERLVRLYEATGENEKASGWRKKLDEAKAVQKKPKT